MASFVLEAFICLAVHGGGDLHDSPALAVGCAKPATLTL